MKSSIFWTIYAAGVVPAVLLGEAIDGLGGFNGLMVWVLIWWFWDGWIMCKKRRKVKKEARK